jgi:N-acetylmuramoyl-L-alanine amidase
MGIKVYIDAGHGGKDPGAQGNGLKEKDVTLDISKRIKKHLEGYEGVTVYMSRTNDTYPSLSARTNDANRKKADLLISVHVNAGGGEGYETWIYTKVGASTKDFANDVHKKIMETKVFTKDRGIKAGNLHMVRESAMEAILLEFGFIDNKSDASKLKSSTNKDKLAKSVAQGVAAHKGLKAKKTSAPSKSNGGGKLYYVQVGAFSDYDNAERLSKKVKKDGFPVTIKAENGKYYVQCGAFSDKGNAERLESKLKKDGYSVYIKHE